MHTTCAPILRAAGALVLSTTMLAATAPPSSSSPPRASAPERAAAPQRVDAPRAFTPEMNARRGYGPTVRLAPPPVSFTHPGGPHAPAPAPTNGGWGGGGWISFDTPWGDDIAGVGYDTGDVGAPSDAPGADGSPIDAALRSYGLEQADCNAPTPLVVIDTPDHHLVCAFPNATVRAGHYTLGRDSHGLIPA
jgi:hypothetical protein